MITSAFPAGFKRPDSVAAPAISSAAAFVAPLPVPAPPLSSQNPMSNYTLTLGPSTPTSAKIHNVAAAALSSTKKSCTYYFDKETKKLWKLTHKTTDGQTILHTDDFFEKTKAEYQNLKIFPLLDKPINKITVGQQNECIINGSSDAGIKFSDNYVREYEDSLQQIEMEVKNEKQIARPTSAVTPKAAAPTKKTSPTGKAAPTLEPTSSSASKASKSSPQRLDPLDAQKKIARCIIDAGAEGNRCAALSVAQVIIEQVKRGDTTTFDTISSGDPRFNKYLKANINDPKSKAELSGFLIRLAIANIRKNPAFQEDGPATSPSYDAILAAVNNYNNSQANEKASINTTNKKDVVAAYADIIQKDGQMLDLPFFLALGVPFIILENNNNKLSPKAISKNLQFPSSDTWFETKESKNLIVVYYNGINHYQSVILSTDENRKSLQTLLMSHKKNLQDRITDCMRQEVKLTKPWEEKISCLASKILDLMEVDHLYKKNIVGELSKLSTRLILDPNADDQAFSKSIAEAMLELEEIRILKGLD